MKKFVKQSVLEYNLEDFDEWSGGTRYKAEQKILNIENERNSKIKITHTKLPKGAVKKILAKNKNEKEAKKGGDKGQMADDLEKIRAKYKEEMADMNEEEL
jgi:hypothetical protein